MKSPKATVIFLSAHSLFRMRTERGLILQNCGKRLVRRPCAFLKKLQKGREIIDFTAFSGGDEEDRTLDLTDANASGVVICVDFYPFPDLSSKKRMVLWPLVPTVPMCPGAVCGEYCGHKTSLAGNAPTRPHCCP